MHLRTLTTLTASVFSATSVFAQEVTPADPVFLPGENAQTGFSFTAGAIATTRLSASDDLDHVENELELYFEANFGNGFHSGVVLTSLYDNPDDSFEYELTFGYGADFGAGLSWDLTYGYIGLNSSDDDEHEITATLGFPLGERIDGAFAVIYDPESGRSDQEIALETALNDRWTLFGLVGNSDRDDNLYAELGVSYALTDQVALEVLLEDTNDGDALIGISVGYEFGS